MKFPKDETLGLAFLAIGLIALMLLAPGLFTSAEPALLRVLLGWGAFVIVVTLVVGGIALTFAGKMGWRARWDVVAWSELGLLSLLVLSHLGQARPLDAALAGRGGGVVGWAVSEFLGLLLPPVLVWAIGIGGLVIAIWRLWLTLPPTWTAPPSAGVGRWPRRLGESVSRGLARAPAWVADAGAWLVDLLRNLRPGAMPAGDPADFDEATGDLPPTRRRGRAVIETTALPEPARPTAKERASRRKSRPDTLPPLDLLRPNDGHANGNADVRQRAQILKQTLAEFGVPVEVVSIKEGPTVTQFGLEPGEIVRELRSGEIRRRRVSVASILRLSNDLALALAAASIRIEAPVPGRPYVGVEVPNTKKTLVSLRSILESREYARVSSPLTAALGRDVSGDPVVVDLTRLPHLLIAGATGSGKSVCINAIVCSLLMNNRPSTVQLLMVDPKMVELPAYNGIPHLIGQVITDTSQVTGALTWLTLQMDDRYRTFAANGVRNIAEYNHKATKKRALDTLPYIVLVIDELADLMMVTAYDIERLICRLAQMARATGIHLVLATQRPSVDVITGLIKANFPARIAFAVTSQTDSRVILDTPGAEKLLGCGDMLFMAPDSAKLSRIQGCFVSDQEIDRIVHFWKTSQPEDETDTPQIAPWVGLMDEMEERDELLEQALALLQTKSQASVSLLQRQLRIGFPRAARLMEQLEEMGVVGPDEGGGRSRAVLLPAGDESAG
ncbi:MAG: hypothetical protein CVU38_04510 [Chloroflexi bacterium HGW-Chloroflexi-1]|nr:MAG: hypothetical protein CVU38_04510 [Chloroflexi bacterium HGW-Chloroflexi-1]